MSGKAKDHTGERYGYLTVIALTEERKPVSKNRIWLCRCDCGNYVKVPTSEFSKSGHTKSCGCKKLEMMTEAATKHGGHRDRLYTVWTGLRKRCNDVNDKDYAEYGGRGITVSEAFSTYERFRTWALENGYDPSAKVGGCTIDRIDVNGNYSPENCRWVNAEVQQNNKRNNVFLEFNGERKTISQWEHEKHYSKDLIRDRIERGWSIADAILLKPEKRRRENRH